MEVQFEGALGYLELLSHAFVGSTLRDEAHNLPLPQSKQLTD
jgi:hypothetical protein